MALLLHLLLLFLLHLSFSSAYPLYHTCGWDNYTANSTYQSNLNQLLNSFTSLNSNFSALANGSNPDTAYGLILCRGDVSPSNCRACIQNAVLDVVSFCPNSKRANSKRASVWYANCQLRYSDVRFFSLVDISIPEILYNEQNVPGNPESFIRLQRKLLDTIAYQAAYNSSLLFATGTAVNGSDVTVYGLAQCTRDLSNDSCSQCLQQIRDVYSGFEEKIGGRILAESCNFRYEMYPFYEVRETILLNLTGPIPPPPPPSPPLVISPPPPSPPLVISPPPAQSTGKKRSITTTVLVIVILSAAALVLVLSICIFCWRRIARKKVLGLDKLEKMSYMEESLLLDLSTIKAATADFSPAHKLGEGGFGSVYKGILPDGQEIAVKRLSTRSSQGMKELKNELVLVAKLQHKNLVRLRGVCLEKEEKLLVYEYVPNRSLDTFLFDQFQQKKLNWEMRFKIIGGISQGLHYLHEESHFTVIHRDLKASNILLDADMNPKISDFGLSKLFGCEEKECTTRRVVGTLGYMAPEYIKRGHFSMKSDVYSFGVLLLEIVTGRKRSKFHHSGNYSDLLSYTWEHWTNGRGLEILDPSVRENFSENEVLICIQIGLLCTQEVPADRPLMSSVLLMLNSHSVTLPAPSQPTFDVRPRTSTSEISEQKSDLAHISGSRNNASISVLEPR